MKSAISNRLYTIQLCFKTEGQSACSWKGGGGGGGVEGVRAITMRNMLTQITNETCFAVKIVRIKQHIAPIMIERHLL